MHHADLIEHRRPWIRDQPLQVGLTRSLSQPNDDVLLRIARAYQLASAAERNRGVVRGGPWQRIRSNHMAELVALLEAGQPGPLREYLRELPVREAGHGFFQGTATLAATQTDAAAERRRLIWIVDSLCGLAEWLGLLAVTCPEGRATIPSGPPRPEELVERIEACTGLPLGVPDVCAGLFGLAVGDRVVHVRSACAVYAACRIRDWLLEKTGRPLSECTVGEIGPGIGLVPTLLGSLGARRLVLVDLPELNAIQAYFLSQSLPTHKLVLFGETLPGEERCVTIMPDFEFLDGPPLRLDLVLNQDSLPELDLATVRRYLDRLPAVTELFVSLNQETRVPEATPLEGGFLPSLLRTSSAYQCLARTPSWCRAGYLEELFVCRQAGPAEGARLATATASASRDTASA